MPYNKNWEFSLCLSRLAWEILFLKQMSTWSWVPSSRSSGWRVKQSPHWRRFNLIEKRVCSYLIQHHSVLFKVSCRILSVLRFDTTNPLKHDWGTHARGAHMYVSPMRILVQIITEKTCQSLPAYQVQYSGKFFCPKLYIVCVCVYIYIYICIYKLFIDIIINIKHFKYIGLLKKIPNRNLSKYYCR